VSDVVVRGGDVVRDGRVERLDVVIVDGAIRGLQPAGTAETTGARVVDAGGLQVFPGVVDAHVHFDDPGRSWWEGFDAGSAAAVAGGVTTVVDMPIDSDPPTITVTAMRAKADAARRRSRVDVALWAGLTPTSISELPAMAAAGAAGFKAFACPSGWDDFPPVDDASLDAGCHVAAGFDIPVAVHCERPDLASGPGTEIEAVRWAAAIAVDAGARLHVVHVSAHGAVEEARRWPGVTTETCPHYLTLTDDDVERIGATARCAPPIRDAANRDALWSLLRAGEIDWVASDHSPCPPEQKRGPEPWNGISGVQLTLSVLLDDGALDPPTLAHLTTAAARALRLRRKGAIKIGMDADLALVDPTRRWTVTPDALFDRHRSSPLVGRTLTGQVVHTLVRGRTVFTVNRGVITDPGGGQVLRPG
jgi:allantoinase